MALLTFTNEQKGVFLIIFGIVLLLHTLGILEQWLNYILGFIAIALIVYGFFKAGYVQKLITQEEKKPEE